MLRFLVVTDPMCSWCWGMSPAVEEAAYRLAGEVDFDFLLGGVNTHGTQPIGDYGRRLLMHIWREVQDTTGQQFGFHLPDPLVFNSTLPSVLVERDGHRRLLAGGYADAAMLETLIRQELQAVG